MTYSRPFTGYSPPPRSGILETTIYGKTTQKMVFQQLIPDDAGFDSSTPSWPGLTGPSTPLVEQNHSLAF
jgi:hypothetical protein